jgi:hypothetical protein
MLKDRVWLAGVSDPDWRAITFPSSRIPRCVCYLANRMMGCRSSLRRSSDQPSVRSTSGVLRFAIAGKA